MGLQQVCVCAQIIIYFHTLYGSTTSVCVCARTCVCILKEKNERKSNQIFN